jgi:hypothetical protein
VGAAASCSAAKTGAGAGAPDGGEGSGTGTGSSGTTAASSGVATSGSGSNSSSSGSGNASSGSGDGSSGSGNGSTDGGRGSSDGGADASSSGGCGNSGGDQIFVSPTGKDSNAGTQAEPLATLAAAQTMVRGNSDRGKVAITVNVLPGTYYVGNTIVFTQADSGTKSAPVTYFGAGNAILSGGVPLNGLTWTAYQNGIMKAVVPASTFANLSFDDGKAAPTVRSPSPGNSNPTYGFSSVLFLNGKRQHMARYPNYKDPTLAYGGNAGDAQSRDSGWKHQPSPAQPAYLHGVHGQLWGSEDYVLTGGGKQNGPLCNGRPQGLSSTQFVENAFDELDSPGEWYYDRTGLFGTAGTVYFYPPAGIDLTMASSYTLEMASIERIFEFDGGCGTGAARSLGDGGVGLPSYSMTSTCASTPPVQWINLDGFHYIDTLRTFPSCNKQIRRSDWSIYRGGALFVTGAENVAISNSFFDQLGGAGVFVSGYNDSVAVTGNLFIDTGSSAIVFMGTNNAVRNALFGYGASTVPVNQLDMTPGPQTNDYPSNCSATENLIHDIGDPELQVAGVAIDMAANITVSHNSIYNMPRAGINVGDGCWGGHVITYNDVFATVLFTGDHGAYNSWGRDRYWDSNTGSIESRVGNPLNSLAVLDAMNPITMAHNRWRCDQGWDVDLDDGSSNYKFTDNVFLSGGLKWREGYYRDGENSVLVQQNPTPCAPNAAVTDVSGCLSAHVRPKGSSDVFIHNIFWGLAPDSPDAYGKEIDYNLYQSASELSTAQHNYGTDVHSASGNPGFLDPANGDFQLGTNSPAIALGITSLPSAATEQYGVTVPSLRAQAATPPFGKCRPLGREHGRRDARLHDDDDLARRDDRECLRCLGRGSRVRGRRSPADRPGGKSGCDRRLRKKRRDPRVQRAGRCVPGRPDPPVRRDDRQSDDSGRYLAIANERDPRDYQVTRFADPSTCAEQPKSRRTHAESNRLSLLGDLS